ncbi:cation:proton antiporter domain-containing protein [Jatrophihabitans sp. YIM 134969]
MSPVDAALIVLGLVVVVGVTAGLCDRLGWPTPLVLVVVGVGIASIPGVPDVVIEPDLVLLGLLPPLLYAAAIRSSLVDFRNNKAAVLMMAVGAVVFTTFFVGLVTWWVAPAVSFAAAVALGAVVAPPDAVAATALGKRLGMPRPITTLLENESLVNDAAALVALNVAIAALTRSVGIGEVGWRFALAAGGGVAIGVVVALVLAAVRRRITDPVLDTTLSFAAPFLAFLPAEEAHSSGVLATVVCGLVLAQRAPKVQTAQSRVAEATNWRTVAFLLENAVFLLIGLQLPVLLAAVQKSNLSVGTVVSTCAAVLVATIAARFVWVFGAAGLWRAARRDPWPASDSTLISWAGMRGVVTLAAALLIPEDTPQRPLLQLAAFVVVAGTLLIQGLSLPSLVRRLKVAGPDPAEDALQTASLVSAATQAGLQRLDDLLVGDEPEAVVQALRDRADTRVNSAWEVLGRPDAEYEPPSAMYRRLRVQMLTAERQVVVDARDEGRADDEVLRGALAAIDLEESLLDRADDLGARDHDQELVPGRRLVAACEHLADAPTVIRMLTPGVCGECVREGTAWVHLRACLTCGNVGCCDSSERRHAEAHFHQTSHAVMRSAEPGEAWRWCYVDEQIG